MSHRYKPTPKTQLAKALSYITLPIIAAICLVTSSCGDITISLQENASQSYEGETLTQHINDLDMARTAKGCPSQIIRHTGFTLSYNNNLRLANWVGYELTAEETDGDVERTDWFDPDPYIKGIKVRHADYTHSGFDRGHLAPAADMRWSEQAMVESFYMSNICPQVHALNAGAWNNLEQRVRTWAKRDSAIIVVSGPIVGENPMTIGDNRVAVPTHFYKVVAAPYNDKPRGIAFIMPNEDIDAPLHKYAVTIDSVENLTGIDFLYNLPDTLENYIEHTIDLKSWKL